ncbi:DUF63 family protein [Methanothermococcus sp. Ax23]|uniref:DUF63 family protein n=1 Tax=Methanothermococcus sp. Ax23 TaxID=3156486 RepID=UPI003BA0401F
MDLKEAFLEFVYKYYINPIETKSGYNLIQEITYGILLFVMVYGFYRVCKLLNIDIDRKFALITIFYVILISLIRALVDAGYVPHTYYTVTPGIVVSVGLYYIISIILSGILFKKEKYHISAMLMAIIPTIYLLSIFLKNMVHIEALFYVFGIIGITYGIMIYLIERIEVLKNKLKFDSIDKYAIFSQLTDASATAIGIGVYGYWEQHPIPRFFMDIFGPYVMIPLKLIVVISVLYIINEEVDNKDLRNILKITIMALGLAPGLRDLFRTVMGV